MGDKVLPWFPPRAGGYCTQKAKEITSAGFEMAFVSEGSACWEQTHKKNPIWALKSFIVNNKY